MSRRMMWRKLFARATIVAFIAQNHDHTLVIYLPKLIFPLKKMRFFTPV
jgi:hypothetical protein